MNHRKILFVCDKNECTSFGRLTLNLAQAVNGIFEPHVLWLKTPKFFEKGSGPSENSTYVSHEMWAKSLESGFFSFRKPLKKLCKKITPDVVFFIRPELGFLVPVTNSCVSQTVMFVHDTFAETLYPNSLKFKLLNLFFIKPTVKATSFVYNSQWTREEASKFFGPKMSEKAGAVIGCPIDQELFCKPAVAPTAEEKKSFRRKYGIRNFKGMCLNVSLDEPRKNIETFFKMAELRPHVAFVRVGKFSERLRTIVNEKKLYNVYHFSQFKAKELRDFYIHSDLMVYPSLLEGFGLPPIEAIACGTPALCAETSAVAENLKGVCPLIKDPTDAQAFVQVVDKVLAGEQVVHLEAAENLLKRCSMEAFCKRVMDFLNSTKK